MTQDWTQPALLGVRYRATRGAALSPPWKIAKFAAKQATDAEHYFFLSFYITSVILVQQPYKLHRLDKGPATTSTLNGKDALKIYENMVAVRRIETASGNLYKDKIIRGFCHLYSGKDCIMVNIISIY